MTERNATTTDEPDERLRRDWDRLRAEATTAAERAEIDAVFARHAA